MNKFKQKHILSAGIFILIISIILAYISPAGSYELSIYGSTPIIYWIGIGLALLISILISLNTKIKSIRILSIILGNISIVSIISLPIIRNYYYFGSGDSISHLGFAKTILETNTYSDASFYPFIHILAAIITLTSNITLNKSMVLVLPIFATVFLLFIPLILKTIYGKYNSDLILIGTYSSMFFLPINLISTHFQPHPSSQALLYSPIVIYLFLKILKVKNNRFILLYIFSFLALLLLHPQQALGCLFIFSIVIIFNKIYNRDISLSFKIMLTSVFLFWVWSRNQLKFVSNLYFVFISLLYGYIDPGSDVLEKGITLFNLGGSSLEVILKLFLLTGLFGYITLVYLYWDRNNTNRTDKELITSFFLSIVPLFLLSFIYLILGRGVGQSQRYMGMIQVIITITGSYSFFHLTQSLKRFNKTTIMFIFISIGLILSTITLFPSPYIYRSNPHVPKTQYQGYDTIFNFYNEGLKLSSIRVQANRFYITTQTQPRIILIRSDFLYAPDHFNNQSLSKYYEDNTYLAITESEVKVDVELYNGFRFSNDDFKYLNQDSSICKILCNSGFDLYIVYSSN